MQSGTEIGASFGHTKVFGMIYGLRRAKLLLPDSRQTEGKKKEAIDGAVPGDIRVPDLHTSILSLEIG